MAKRIEPATVWAAYENGHNTLGAWLAALPDSAWNASSTLPSWTVAELVAHIATVADSVTALEIAPQDTAARTLGDYLESYRSVADSIGETAREVVAETRGEPAELLDRVDESWTAASRTIERIGMRDQVVTTRRVPTRLTDYLLTRVIEIVVHTDDLARSVPGVPPPAVPRDTARLGTRALLDVLAERAPGRSVEVRVAPHAAVQCVEGPRHTRGTPPNVVEMAPAVWWRLAAGRTTWSEEIASGTVVASGERADISAFLPVVT